jgi:hypothetical protein
MSVIERTVPWTEPDGTPTTSGSHPHYALWNHETREWDPVAPLPYPEDDILAERARIREAVKGLPGVPCQRYHEHTDKQPYPSGGVDRAAVLAIVEDPTDD